MTRPERWSEERLAIPVELLDERARKRPWSNLGDWSEALDYSAACCALACRIGRAANLGPGDKVLELACGHGASLSLWSEVFCVQIVDAIEVQTRAIASIETDRPPALRNLWRVDVNLIFSAAKPWPMDERYDAILVVDAAYHFRNLRSFLEKSRERLKPGAPIVFTSFMLAAKGSSAPGWQRRMLRALLESALIPPENLVTDDELRALFQNAGFAAPVSEILDQEVLGGFARFVAQRRQELGWRQRASVAWWKVEATAAAARFLLRTGFLHYVLIKAVKL